MASNAAVPASAGTGAASSGLEGVRWGILSCGLISSDFVAGLRSAGATIVACGARSLDSALKFGKERGIPTCYGSYEELVKDPSVDIVYIGSIHPGHYEHSLLALNHGKHILIEKPVTLNKKQAEEIYKVAKEKKLFAMEAMWTAFFPVHEKVRSIISSGTIGTVFYGSSDFGVQFPLNIDRVWKPELGGGTVLDIGIYPIYAMMMHVGGGEQPLKITASGVVREGVDIYGSVILQFSNDKICNANWTGLVNTPKQTIISGTKGTIIIHTPSYCPEKLTLKLNTGEVEEFHFPLPEPYGGKQLNFLNSSGMHYQAKTVTQYIKEGKQESPLITHELSLRVIGVIDEIRAQIGLKYPQEL